MALPNGTTATEEGDDEHHGSDHDEYPRRHRKVGLELILDHAPVEQEGHADADDRKPEEL